MSEILSLPTDSLYKLLALSGLLVMFSSVFFILKRKTSIDEKLYNIERAQVENQARAKFIKDQKNPDSALEIFVRNEVQGVDLKETKRLIKQSMTASGLLILCFSIGLTMSVSGFVLWYKKIQVYQDILIEVKVKKLKENANKTLQIDR